MNAQIAAVFGVLVYHAGDVGCAGQWDVVCGRNVLFLSAGEQCFDIAEVLLGDGTCLISGEQGTVPGDDLRYFGHQ